MPNVNGLTWVTHSAEWAVCMRRIGHGHTPGGRGAPPPEAGRGSVRVGYFFSAPPVTSEATAAIRHAPRANQKATERPFWNGPVTRCGKKLRPVR
jgi:hypothetical protein